MRANRMCILCIPRARQGYRRRRMSSDPRALDRGLSDIDHPILVSVSYVYDLPKLRNGNSALKYIVNGWSTAGLITAPVGRYSDRIRGYGYTL